MDVIAKPMTTNHASCEEGSLPAHGVLLHSEITFTRRKELMQIASNLVEKLVREGVKPQELCFLRRAAEMLIER